jgi:hypothetical protein
MAGNENHLEVGLEFTTIRERVAWESVDAAGSNLLKGADSARGVESRSQRFQNRHHS